MHTLLSSLVVDTPDQSDMDEVARRPPPHILTALEEIEAAHRRRLLEEG